MRVFNSILRKIDIKQYNVCRMSAELLMIANNFMLYMNIENKPRLEETIPYHFLFVHLMLVLEINCWLEKPSIDSDPYY